MANAKYVYFCVDENKFIDEIAGATPTVCKNNPAHVINAVVPVPFDSGQTLTDTQAATKEPTGFVNRTTSTISFDNPSRVLTITPIGTLEVWVKGIKYLFTTPQSITPMTNTEGLWYIYFDANGVLQRSQTLWDLSLVAPVAIVYWDATNTVAISVQDERHGFMGWETHQYLHQTIGTRYESGLSLTWTSGNGSLDAHAQVAVGDGYIQDEDIRFSIATGSPQTLAPIAQLPVFYLTGASAFWRKTTATNFPLSQGAVLPYYNEFTGGAWQQTEVPTTDFMAMWIYGTVNQAEPVIAIMGQRVDTSLANAQTNNTLASLVFGSLPFQEMKPLFRVIFECRSTYGNTPKSRIVDVQDLRAVSTVASSAYVATAHSSLTGLSNPDHPASAIYTNPATFGGSLTPADTSVQLALDTLDHPIKFAPTGQAVAPSMTEGQWYYDTVKKGTIQATDISGVTLSWGKMVAIRVRNETGAVINKGEVVRQVVGADPNGYFRVMKAQANSAANCYATGVMLNTVNDLEYGWMLVVGFIIMDTQTPGWTTGQKLYLSSATAGALTTTQPDIVVPIGQVVKVGTTDGTLYVRPAPPVGAGTVALPAPLYSGSSGTPTLILITNDRIVVRCTGNVTATVYYTAPLPYDCDQLLSVSFIVRRTGTGDSWTGTLSSGGAADANISAVDLTPTAAGVWETKTFTPASVYTGGATLLLTVAMDTNNTSTYDLTGILLKYRRI